MSREIFLFIDFIKVVPEYDTELATIVRKRFAFHTYAALLLPTAEGHEPANKSQSVPDVAVLTEDVVSLAVWIVSAPDVS